MKKVIIFLFIGVAVLVGLSLYKVEAPAKFYYWAQFGGDVFPNWTEKWDLGKWNYWWDTSYVRVGKFKWIIADSGIDINVLHLDTLYVDIVKSEPKVVSGADTIHFWYHNANPVNSAFYINPSATNDTLDHDFWIKDSCVNSKHAILIELKNAQNNKVLYGSHSDLSATGSGSTVYGDYRKVNIGSLGHENGQLFGEYNELNAYGGADKIYGQYTYIHRFTGSEAVIGSYNRVENEDVGDGDNYGTYNEICPCGTGKHIGTYNTMGGFSGSDTAAGNWNMVDGSASVNNNTLIGTYNKITGETGDTCIGVYAYITGGTVNYAGYFDGDVKVNGAMEVGDRLVAGSDSVAGKIVFAGASRVATYILGLDVGDVCLVNLINSDEDVADVCVVNGRCKADSLIINTWTSVVLGAWSAFSLTDTVSYLIVRK